MLNYYNDNDLIAVRPISTSHNILILTDLD